MLQMQRSRRQSIWQDLLKRFLAVLAAPVDDGEEKWTAVWKLLVQHPWYQAQLRSCARRVAWDAPARQRIDDVQQEAMLLLARNLQRNSDLRMDPEKARQHFVGWMRTIITNDCREALRRLRRQYERDLELEAGDLVRDDWAQLESRIDLELAIERLPEPERTVLTLWVSGYAVKEIKAKLGLTLSRTYRALNRGRTALSRILSPDETGGDGQGEAGELSLAPESDETPRSGSRCGLRSSS